jgi:hypothetical protein
MNFVKFLVEVPLGVSWTPCVYFPYLRAGIVIGVACWLGDQGPITGRGFSLRHLDQAGSGIDPASCQWVPRTLSLGIKQHGRECNPSSPSSAYVKNAWNRQCCLTPVWKKKKSCTSTPPNIFMTWCLTKH